jgi:hypothetical protein
MPTAGAERPEERDASGIGFYFNADDTWHNDAPAPRQVWDPAWIAPPPADWPAEPPVRRRRSGVAVALGLALMATAAVALTWSLTPAARLSPPVRPSEPPSAVLVPPLPVEPPAPAAAPPAKLATTPAPAPAPARAAKPAQHPASARLARHHRQHLRTTHRRHAAARPAARPHSRTLRHSTVHRSRSAPAAVRRALRHGPAAPHDRNNFPAR